MQQLEEKQNITFILYLDEYLMQKDWIFILAHNDKAMDKTIDLYLVKMGVLCVFDVVVNINISVIVNCNC